MKFELKNIKYFASGSHETFCFTATGYVDGKKAFFVSNDGSGGCHLYQDIKNLQISTEFDNVVDDEMVKYLQRSDAKKLLKRITYTKPNNDGIFQLPAKHKPTAAIIAQVKACDWWTSGYTMLNELTLDEVVAKLP